MVGILGSGFGLYGYLPAVCLSSDESVMVELKNYNKINNRKDLKKHIDRIKWAVNDKDIINNSNLLIIAYPPSEVNSHLLSKILESSVVSKLIVEKPICSTPKKSKYFIDTIEENGIEVVSGYLFIYTDWFKKISETEKDIEIIWDHVKKFEDNSWKNKVKSGGGALRFYGIHLVSILAYYNFSVEDIVLNDTDNFEAFFINKKGRKIRIKIFIGGLKYKFKVSLIENSSSPFSTFNNDGYDYRVKYLISLLKDFSQDIKKLNLLMVKKCMNIKILYMKEI